jgi:hypothetical protein
MASISAERKRNFSQPMAVCLQKTETMEAGRKEAKENLY